MNSAGETRPGTRDDFNCQCNSPFLAWKNVSKVTDMQLDLKSIFAT